MLLRETARDDAGGNVLFAPPRVGQVWMVESVTFQFGGFPIATFAYSMSVLRGGFNGVPILVLRNDTAPNSTAPQSYQSELVHPEVIYSGEQLAAVYGAGAVATSFAVMVRGQIKSEREV